MASFNDVLTPAQQAASGQQTVAGLFNAQAAANGGGQTGLQLWTAQNAGGGSAAPGLTPTQQLASNQAEATIASAAQGAAANAINAAQQKAQQAYWEALAAGLDKDRAEKAAEFAATNELGVQAQQLSAQNQAYTQGMGVLGLVAQLQGPSNAFTQQAVLHGINASGLSRAVDALSGTVLPSFGANQATPQAASLQSLIGQVSPGATFSGAASAPTAVPSINQIMSTPGGNWTGAPSAANSPQLAGQNLTAYQVLTANNGSPAAGMTQDQFQAFMNTHSGRTPVDAWELADWGKANPGATAASTAPAPTVTAPSLPGGSSVGGVAGGSSLTGSGLTPGTGGASTADYLSALPAPNKINSTNWMQLDPDTQQFLLGAYRQAGYSDNDVLGAVKNTLPQFKAPAVGAIGAPQG